PLKQSWMALLGTLQSRLPHSSRRQNEQREANMADETKDYIEEAQLEARLRFGDELSPQELAEKFAGHDMDSRIYHLKNLKGPEAITAREAARRMGYERALVNVHQMLRKVGR